MDLNNKTTGLLIFFTVTVLLSACKKEVKPVLPNGSPSVQFNFYPASDVMRSYARNVYTGIYIDHYVADLGNRRPTIYFSFNTDGVSNEFPRPINNSHSNVPGVVSYLDYDAGGHRLMFADTANAIVLDTAVNVPPESLNCFYLTDAMTAENAPPAYRLVAVQEERSGIAPDRVGIRFVHLSADAGPLVCSIQREDGTFTNATDEVLHFGEASPYRYYSAADTVTGLLRFSLDNPANGANVLTGMAFRPGQTYVVAISGFYKDQQRQVNTGKNPDGSIKYKSMTISRNLRAVLRRTY